jgi:hypothetical protein
MVRGLTLPGDNKDSDVIEGEVIEGEIEPLSTELVPAVPIREFEAPVGVEWKRPCAWCGTLFVATGRDKYHSPECRIQRNLAVAKDKRRQALVSGASQCRSRGERKVCAWCGVTFTDDYGNRKYCPESERDCSRQALKAQIARWNQAHKG